MKKNDVQIGGHYAAKVSDRMTTVRIDAENPSGGWDATNVRTGKKVRIKSARRLRHATRGPGQRGGTGKKASDEHLRAVHEADPASPEATPRQAQANARKAEQRANAPDGQTASERAMADFCEDAARPTGIKVEASKDAKPAAERDTGARDATGGQRDAKPMSLLDAAAHLLSLGTGDPMRCKDIVDLAIERGLWAPRNGGKTPANTLSAAMRREIKAKGDASRFRLAERGRFELNR